MKYLLIHPLHVYPLTLSQTISEPFSSDLRVDIQDAGASCGHHLMDGLDLGAVQVAVVLAVLQEPASPHVYLHLRPCGEVVGVAVQLIVARPP